MSAIGRARAWLRAALQRRRIERDMQDEMNAHLSQAAERFRARGLSEHDAMLAARREFGNVAVLQEDSRDARGARWIESTIGDLRHAIRHYGRTPLMAATIVLTLTLGIGVSSAAFGIVSGILLRPPPGVPRDKSLVAIRGIAVEDGQRHGRQFSYPELTEYARRPEFVDVAGWASSVVVAGLEGQESGTAYVQFVTPNLFRALGLRLAAGTGFTAARLEDHSVPELTAIIGHSFAINQFGAVGSAVGKSITLNGVRVVITGVAPPRFLSAFGDGEIRTLWMPVSAWPVVDQLTGVFTNRADNSFHAVARLHDGIGVRQALPAVELVAAQAAAAAPAMSVPERRRAFTADVVPLRGDVQFKSSRRDDVQAIGLITGLVMLIMLVCTTTVSSLLVGSAVTRRHEIAVRLALGANRRRIVRQLLTESALLSIVAGAAGLLVYALVYRGLRDGLVDADVGPTWTTALVTAVFAVMASVLCGLSPALHATRGGLSGVLQDSGRTATVRSRLQRVFVVAQIALSQPLLVMLAMLIAVVIREGNHGVTQAIAEHVVRADFDTWAAVNRGDNRLPALVQRLSAVPGVVAVVPQVNGTRRLWLELPSTNGSLALRVEARTHQVPPGYFKAMEARIVLGRELVDADSTKSMTPIVIGSDFVARAFGKTNPIGKRLTILGREQRIGEVEIVGVVSTTDVGASESGSGIRIFTPMGGSLAVPVPGFDALLIRTRMPAASLIPSFREIARAEAPLLPVHGMKTLAQIDREARAEIIEATGASALGGMITLFLASIGLYAVVALGVSQRQREIGVRISLGARPSQVVAMFFRSGLRVSLLGLLIGLPLSIGAWKIATTQMSVPRANMPVIALSVMVSVIAVAALASWIPARRAAGADPLSALRDG